MRKERNNAEKVGEKENKMGRQRKIFTNTVDRERNNYAGKEKLKFVRKLETQNNSSMTCLFLKCF